MELISRPCHTAQRECSRERTRARVMLDGRIDDRSARDAERLPLGIAIEYATRLMEAREAYEYPDRGPVL